MKKASAQCAETRILTYGIPLWYQVLLILDTIDVHVYTTIHRPTRVKCTQCDVSDLVARYGEKAVYGPCVAVGD